MPLSIHLEAGNYSVFTETMFDLQQTKPKAYPIHEFKYAIPYFIGLGQSGF
jgi:hypothetical protein